jgi:dihydrodiol dehydrogenase / D-xylose 1-dehydrogenase (NADP)
MSKTIRWGFMGCGKIASDFANAMKLLPKGEHEIVAVAATDLKRAQEFAKSFGVKQAFEGYDKVAQVAEVDIIYVNPLHPAHLKCVQLALNGGKAVLVEKAMGMNAKQVKKMIELAREKKLFMMEGFWTRYFPVYRDVRRAIKDGEIGEPRFFQGNFGHKIDIARILEKKLGGGSMLDFGCYLVSIATMIFDQRPINISAIGKLNKDGVDIMDCITMTYKNGAVAQLMVSAEVPMAQNVHIFGTEGRIEVHKTFNNPTKVTINGQTIEHALPEPNADYFYGNSQGLIYEMQCIRECLLKGDNECSTMTLEHSQIIMEIMDEVRRQVGVVYPEDSQ